jgi:hypothetical protein
VLGAIRLSVFESRSWICEPVAQPQWVKITFASFEHPGDAAVNVVAPLKVDVLEEVAANRALWNGVAYISMPDHCRIAPSTGIGACEDIRRLWV